jgi:hypothetical protein
MADLGDALNGCRTHNRILPGPAMARRGFPHIAPARCGLPESPITTASCPASDTRSLTLDVIFRMWITPAAERGIPSERLSSAHSQWRELLQVKGYGTERGALSPQRHPQVTHRTCGVSAQAVHSPVHSPTGRAVAFAEHCQNHSVERYWQRNDGGPGCRASEPYSGAAGCGNDKGVEPGERRGTGAARGLRAHAAA